MEIIKETPWFRIRNTTACTKNSWRLLAMWIQRAMCERETTAVSATIWISVWKVHHQIRLRVLSCSRVSEKPSRTRSPRGKSPSGRMSRWPCKDYLRGTCNNSFCERWHPPECLFYKTKSGCRFGERSAHSHTVRLMNSRRKGLKKNDDKSAVAILKKGDWQERESVSDACHDRTGQPVKRSDNKLGQNSSKRQLSDARQLGCVFQDMTPPKSILRKSADMPKTIQRVKFKKAIARHTKIRDQKPSLGYICASEPHQRSPNAPKFEDRSQEGTEWQEQGAREAAWKLAKSVLKLKEHQRAAFFSPSGK